MPKSENQKLKILYILKILYEQTDEEHTLTVNEIIKKLKLYGISAARRSVYDDIHLLREFGADIIMRKSKSYEYFLGSRLFETAELKVLIDSVQSSHFVTKKKSEAIITKLKRLTSKPQAQRFANQVFIRERVKNMNESIYYNVDTLHNAIAENKQISFRYFDYDINRNRIFRKNGERYNTNPVSLTYDNENYYFIAYNEKYNDYVHYRVDKMTDIEISSEKRILPKENFDAATYVNPIFSMFDGESEHITAVFHKAYLNTVIDRFGDGVILSEIDNESFQAVFKAAVSPTFLSWIIGFGSGAIIISPEWVSEEVKELALKTLKMYD